MNRDAEDDVLGKAYDARLMRRLLSNVRPYWSLVAVSALALLAYSACDIYQPDLIRRAVDGPIAGWRDRGREEAFSELLRIASIFGGVVLMGWILRAVHMWVVEYLGQRVMLDMRRQLFAKIQTLSLRFFDENPVGRLVTRVVSDMESLYQVLSSGLVSIFGDLVKIVAIVMALLYLNWSLALWLLAVLPVLFLVSLRFRKRFRQAYRDVRRDVARTNASLQESITGVRVVQIFGQEEKAKERFSDLSERLCESHTRTIFLFASFFPAVEFLFGVAQGVLIWVGARHVIGQTLTAGEFIQCWFYIQLVFEPIRNLSEQYNVLQSAMAASERIFKILDTEEEVANPDNPAPLPREKMKGEIVFDRVWFAYRDDWVLRDLSFRVAPGESVALVGATGAGKTSIISLISRLYDVRRGRILLDGRDLREYDKHELRRRVAVVLQDVFLFAGSIRENIRLGRPEISDAAVERAARTVNADPFIRSLDGGYHAPVLERGATLSVGQKQLLAFARALAFDPGILILDEATSSVDTETEILIQEALGPLLADRTSIIIAHRLSTIRRCDRILVMHKGELREEGDHQALLHGRGIYRRLYELQGPAQE